MSLIQEKVNQAVGILAEQGTDMWLTFVRETSGVRDPALDLLLGPNDLTWQSALIVTRGGEKLAVVGNLEKESIERLGVYDTVLGYDTDIRKLLADTITRLDPKTIAINSSHDNVHADGLTHAMYQKLLEIFSGTPYGRRLISSEALVNALRGRKTATEQSHIHTAVQITDEIFKAVFEHLHVGMSEIEVAEWMQAEVEKRGLQLAWPAENCPAVNSGPASPIGHSGPTQIKIEPGHVLHFDFGVKYEGFCSDIQRVGYVLRPGETQAPDPVQRGFDTIREAIEKSRSAMKPGVTGNAIDKLARETVTGAGYANYMHALGHQLGRVAHDGGALLGPLWAKYGNAPLHKLEAGQIFTIEPGLDVPEYGHIGLEEDVVMTDTGAEYLGTPQTEIVLIQ